MSDTHSNLAQRILAHMRRAEEEREARMYEARLIVYIPGGRREFELWRQRHPEFRYARLVYALYPEDVLGFVQIDRVFFGSFPALDGDVQRRRRVIDALRNATRLTPEAREDIKGL